MENVKEATEQYCDHLRSIATYNVEIIDNKKYYKIATYWGQFESSRSVHSFVDKSTGDLYKPGTWDRPAKGVRFNLLTDMEKLKEVMDPYGSYLYRR